MPPSLIFYLNLTLRSLELIKHLSCQGLCCSLGSVPSIYVMLGIQERRSDSPKVIQLVGIYNS